MLKLVLETGVPLVRKRKERRDLEGEIAKCPVGGSYGKLSKYQAVTVAKVMRKLWGKGSSITLKEANGCYRVGRKTSEGSVPSEAQSNEQPSVATNVIPGWPAGHVAPAADLNNEPLSLGQLRERMEADTIARAAQAKAYREAGQQKVDASFAEGVAPLAEVPDDAA